MSSTKLFNKNYLLENMKKSKGSLLLFLSLVPIFTCISLILMANDIGLNVLGTLEISAINIIGMYVIPVIVSYILFGYVYKKTSVDFINSMPITRKSIFITNTIGGIALILIVQIITAILLLICNTFFGNIVIFSQLILDSFIIMTISYIFVFMVTNIAMSISGNVLTQIAVTMLILFLVPFCINMYNGFLYSGYSNYEFIQGGVNDVFISIEKDINYTMPYRIFSMVISSSLVNNAFYNTASLVKMLVLSIIYFVVGKYLFEKRKMENTEESFSNMHLHIVTKGLTMLPMVVILNLIEADFGFNIFVVGLIILYYFVYDIITKKKINFIISTVYLILIFGVLQGGYSGLEFYKEKVENKYIVKSEISYVSLDLNSYTYYDYYYSSTMYNSFVGNRYKSDVLNYYTDNPELLKIIFEDGIQFNGKTDLRYEGIVCVLPINFKMNNGKVIKTSVAYTQKSIDKIIEVLSEDKEYIKLLKDINIKDSVIKIGTKALDKDMENKIKSEIEKEINNMDLRQYYDKMMSINRENDRIPLYYYSNHKMIQVDVNVALNEEIFNTLTKKLNNDANELMKRNTDETYYYSFHISNYAENDDYRDKMYNIGKPIVEFIKNNYNIECNMYEKYYTIKGYVGGVDITFFTNDTDAIDEIIESSKNYMDETTEIGEYYTNTVFMQ